MGRVVLEREAALHKRKEKNELAHQETKRGFAICALHVEMGGVVHDQCFARGTFFEIWLIFGAAEAVELDNSLGRQQAVNRGGCDVGGTAQAGAFRRNVVLVEPRQEVISQRLVTSPVATAGFGSRVCNNKRQKL